MTDYITRLLEGESVEWRILGEVCESRNGYTPSKANPEYWEGGTIPWFRMEDIRTSGGILSEAIQCITPLAVKKSGLFRAGSIIIATTATIGEHALLTTDALANQRFTNFAIRPAFQELLLPKFLYYYFFILDEWCKKNVQVGSFPSVDVEQLKQQPIPIPPMRVQVRIVEVLDAFSALTAELEAELEGRRRQYAHYREQLLALPDAPRLPLGEVCAYAQPGPYLVKSNLYKDHYPTPVLTAGKTFILGYTDETEGIYLASQSPTIIFDDFTTACRWVDFDFKAKSSAMKMLTSRDESQVLLKYIYYWLSAQPSELVESDHKRQWISNYSLKPIPIPPMQEQRRIVEILDRFSTLCESITEGLPREIELRRRQYEYYREQLLTFR